MESKHGAADLFIESKLIHSGTLERIKKKGNQIGPVNGLILSASISEKGTLNELDKQAVNHLDNSINDFWPSLCNFPVIANACWVTKNRRNDFFNDALLLMSNAGIYRNKKNISVVGSLGFKKMLLKGQILGQWNEYIDFYISENITDYGVSGTCYFIFNDSLGCYIDEQVVLTTLISENSFSPIFKFELVNR